MPHPLEAGQLQALDELIDCWSNWELSRNYYLTVLVPALVSTGTFEGATDRELAAIRRLRQVLGPDDWSSLAELIDARKPTAAQARQQALENEAQAQAEIRARAKKLQAEAIEQERLAREKAALLPVLRAHLEEDFLGTEAWLAAHEAAHLLTNDELRHEQAQFVVSRCRRPDIRIDLDAQQALAVSAVGGHYKVAARAGSGKTRVLVARALFLVLHCGVPAHQIMLLAFNTEAAAQLEQRIAAKLKGHPVPFCLTFHALAHGLVHPDEKLLADQGELNRTQSRRVQQCIDELIRSPGHHLKIRRLMLSYFKDDWVQITKRGSHLKPAEALELRRHLERETLRGEFVKSQGERHIANLLFEHGVEYQYERLHNWNGSHYRPDFSILVNRKVAAVIEYFGMEGNAAYDNTTTAKIEYWARRPDVMFIPLYPTDLGEANRMDTTVRVLDALRSLGPACEMLTDEALWAKVKDRAIRRFDETVRTFVDRARQRRWDKVQLHAKAAATPQGSLESKLFVELGASVLEDYLVNLRRHSEEDFAGLMWRGVDFVNRGKTAFRRIAAGQEGDIANLRFIMIDEFQDFSQMFAEMTQAIVHSSPDAQVFAVGDDWQAINEFAGSDLAYFDRFAQDFDRGKELTISTNYRSAREVVNRGNLLMRGRGVPATPGSIEVGWVGVGDIAGFRPNSHERSRFQRDVTTPLILRVLHNLLAEHKEVTLLSRKHHVWWALGRGGKPIKTIESYLLYLEGFLPPDSRRLVNISTAHGYKGQEADVVIILNADTKAFPVIHATAGLFSVFGDTPGRVLDAERRLFYVAATRARQKLLCLYDSSRSEMSEYLAEMDADQQLGRLDPNKLPGMSSDE